jgi:hypothetical protein
VFKQNLNPSYWHINTLKNRQKRNKLRKLQPPTVGGVKKLKKKKKKKKNPTIATKLPPNPSFLCCSVAIRVQRQSIELKVPLL